MIGVKKKAQIIKTLTLKWKMKQHFMKQDDYSLKGGKQHSASSFSFSINKFLSFFVSIMNLQNKVLLKICKNNPERYYKSWKNK
jgi:hypothetical protein